MLVPNHQDSKDPTADLQWDTDHRSSYAKVLDAALIHPAMISPRPLTELREFVPEDSCSERVAIETVPRRSLNIADSLATILGKAHELTLMVVGKIYDSYTGIADLVCAFQYLLQY